MRSYVPPAMQIRKICAAKFGKRKAGETFKSMFGRVESGASSEFGTEQVRHVLRTPSSTGIIRIPMRVLHTRSVVF